MKAKTALTGIDLRRTMTTYHRVLGEHREHLNALNVYPVPDSDTGANLCSTIGEVVDTFTAESGMDAVCRAIRRGAMLGARGASGVITSQILGAMVERFRAEDRVDGLTLAAALSEAADAAYRAVLKPVEGTILTVVRAAAESARYSVASHDGSLLEVAAAAHTAAATTLAATTDMLAELKAAGVVDAGGSGFVLLLDSLLHVIDDRELPEPPAAPSTSAPPAPNAMPRFEVVVRMSAPAAAMNEFRSVWERLGNESTVVVDGGGEWVCHIHTDEPEAAMEAARATGEIHAVFVTDLLEQITELQAARHGDVAVVAVAMGPGLQERFVSRGAAAVVAGGVGRNPSTAELLHAVEATEAHTVIVLPNDENVVPAARQVVELTERQVLVLPTVSMPGGLAAIRAFDPAEPAGGAAAMASTAEKVAAGRVTRAVREATTAHGVIHRGDWMALPSSGDPIVAVTLVDAVTGLVDLLAGSGTPTRVTIVTGNGSDPEVTDETYRRSVDRWPTALVEVIDGGQPFYPYLVGVEGPRPEDA